MKRWLPFAGVFLAGAILLLLTIGNRAPQESKNPEKKISKKTVGREDDEKFDSPQMFARFENEIRTRDGAFGPAYKPNYRINEMKKFGILDPSGSTRAFRLGKSEVGLPWVERGPANVGGRTRGLIVDPDDATGNTWIAGSVGGGIWRTTNAGASWTDLTPDLPNLATTVLAMAASDHNIIYCGTGEGFNNADAIIGDGIFKSTNRGTSWSQLASTAGNSDFHYVNRIIVSPTDAGTVIAATNDGIYRSTDGGTSWDQKYSSASKVQDLIANPLNFNTQFAAVNGYGVIKSVDAGVTWGTKTPGIGSAQRIEIAISSPDTTRLFAAVEAGGASDLYVSDSSGNQWYNAKEQTGIAPNWLGGQGWYDNAISVHPYSKDTVFVGGAGSVHKISINPGQSTVTNRAVDTTGTASFLAFVNFGLPYLGGGVGTGHQFFAPTLPPTSLTGADTTFDIEIRFGPGITQKAHRFLFGASFAFTYMNYVYVPFQVWDVTHNRQLMASFRDQDSNGVFNLSASPIGGVSREYLIVNAVTYDSTTPDTHIAQNSGEVYKCAMAAGPALAAGATWNPNNLPTSTISFGVLKSVVSKLRTTKAIIDAYGQFNGVNPNVHPDHHHFIMIPVNQVSNTFKILDASDGGLAMSTNSGRTWTIDQSTVIGFNTTQFYDVDRKGGANQFIGGTQDNGTWLSPASPTATSPWTFVLGGDGFGVAWNYANGNKLLGSIYNDRIYQSKDGGTTFNSLSNNGLGDYDNVNSPFITRIGRSKIDPDLVFTIGPSGVWRSDNFGDKWTLATVSNLGYNTLMDLAVISVKNPQIVWAASRMTSTNKVNLSTDGGLTFNAVNSYTTVTLGRVTGLATHPTEDSTAYALFSIADAPKILKTTNLGQSWTDISGFGTNPTSSNGYPNVATYCLLVMPDDPTEIWAGTEIGIFRSTDSGANWNYANNGIPAVSIWEMNIVDQEINVATHGRGIWSVTRNTIGALPSAVLSPRINTAAQVPGTGALAITMSLRSVYDSTVVMVNSARYLKLNVASVKDTTVNYPVVSAATFPVQVISYKGGKSYKSPSQSVSVVQAQAARTIYTNNFNSGAGDFTTSGLTVSTASGFSDAALQSPHPYVVSTSYTAQLNVPIIVSSDTTKRIAFDEIAIVEPGDPGTVFGDPNFWDYVIVEGTSDGTTWVPLADGWDCRLHTEWETAFNTGGNGTPAMYFKHLINPSKKFAGGTTIYIRFRLLSDEAAVGWGWAIDNLKVNADIDAPTLVLGALASPVVNVVRFGVGANEPLSAATVSVNLVGQTVTQQGKLFFANYTITGPGALAVFATGTDTAANSSNATKSFTVSLLSKASVYNNYTVQGSGEGYLLVSPSMSSSAPSSWTQLGEAIEWTATSAVPDLDVKAHYDNLAPLQSKYKDFDESKIGFYEFVNGAWQYAGGEGSSKNIAAKLTGHQIGVFYNPDHTALPKEFALEQNYPNPFNPNTTIRYSVPAQSKVVIKVYNMLGQQVRTIVNENKAAGRYQIVWDGKNQFGNAVASGVYLYRLEAGKVVKAKKMLLIK